jgi:hypothetical protein
MSHDGFMFHGSGRVLDIANDASADFLMVVPAFCYPHIQRVRLDLEAGDVEMDMYEGATTSADGAAIPVFNTNRNSSNTPAALPYGAPTVTDVGDIFHKRWVPASGVGVGTNVGVMDINAFGEEWILAPATKYLWRITNRSGGTLDLAFEFVWYEIGEDAE